MPAAAGVVVLASLTAGLWVANRERRIAERRFTDVRQLANKLFDIEYEIRKLAGGTKTSEFIVDTSLEYLRRLAGDVHEDPTLGLELATAFMRVARVQGVPTARNLGQMDRAEENLRRAEEYLQSVLKQQPANRSALFRSAQVTHDRMLLARYNGHFDVALNLASTSARWLEKFQAKAGDKADASPILSTYLNVADQFARAERFDEALRLCRRAGDFIGVTGRQDYLPDFLWIASDIHRGQGELDQALKDLDEAVRLTDPGASAELWRTMNFSLGLILKGELLGEPNSLNLGRPAEAVDCLNHAFRLADDLAHRDPDDQMSRSRVANAGIALAGILTASNPSQALRVYDHVLRHLGQIQNNSSFRRFEVSVLAGSSYALRKLDRAGEAKQRLDKAFEILGQLNLYPGKRFQLGSEVEESLRALADYESGAANLQRAVQLYTELLVNAQPAKSSPETSLTDAIRQSTIYRGAALVNRRAGKPEAAAGLENRDRVLWLHWDRTLPNRAFVRHHLGLDSGKFWMVN